MNKCIFSSNYNLPPGTTGRDVESSYPFIDDDGEEQQSKKVQAADDEYKFRKENRD